MQATVVEHGRVEGEAKAIIPPVVRDAAHPQAAAGERAIRSGGVAVVEPAPGVEGETARERGMKAQSRTLDDRFEAAASCDRPGDRVISTLFTTALEDPQPVPSRRQRPARPQYDLIDTCALLAGVPATQDLTGPGIVIQIDPEPIDLDRPVKADQADIGERMAARRSGVRSTLGVC